LAFHILAALPSLLVWWMSHLHIGRGWKVILAIAGLAPTPLFLFWLLYVSVVAAPVLPAVWLVFALILWVALRVLRRDRSQAHEG
ncbi:MAG: hypothetical protein WCK50_04825, partial [bacterium]